MPKLETHSPAGWFSFLYLPSLPVLALGCALTGGIYQLILDQITIDYYRLALLGLFAVAVLAATSYVLSIGGVRHPIPLYITSVISVSSALAGSYLAPYAHLVHSSASKHHLSMVQIILSYTPVDYWRERMEAGFVRKMMSGSRMEEKGMAIQLYWLAEAAILLLFAMGGTAKNPDLRRPYCPGCDKQMEYNYLGHKAGFDANDKFACEDDEALLRLIHLSPPASTRGRRTLVFTSFSCPSCHAANYITIRSLLEPAFPGASLFDDVTTVIELAKISTDTLAIAKQQLEPTQDAEGDDDEHDDDEETGLENAREEPAER